MAYCRECGKELLKDEKNCSICGFPNPEFVEIEDNISGDDNFKITNENNDNTQNDLEGTNEVIEGSYSMPGSPGYTPKQGVKYVSSSENGFKTEEVNKETYKEVITEDRKYEEPVNIDSDVTKKDESFEDTMPIEEGVV